MTLWLLKQDVAEELRHGFRSFSHYTGEQRQQFASHAARVERAGTHVTVAGDVAEIRVEGLLTKKPSFLAWLLGFVNTTYEGVADGLAVAARDPAVKRATLSIDSPGGEVHGLFELLAALEGFDKPLTAFASCACSAAYAIAAKAGSIKAATPASQFGSVGVAVSIFVDDSVVQIASTDAPNKRPDVRTDEGQSIVRKELDDIHDLFVDAIARGRKTTKATVNAEYGRGGTVLAMDAKRRGMIDAVFVPATKKTKATASPHTNLPLYLAQRFGGPMLGESDTEFSERQRVFIEKCSEIKARGGTHEDYAKLFAGDEHDRFQTSNRSTDASEDLGDLVVAEMERRRGIVRQ